MDNQIFEVGSLKWIPFIGANYYNGVCGKKILLVGESHYHENNKQSIDKHNNANFTKIVVNELAINRHYWSTKMFSNLHRAFIGNDNFDTNKFWDSLAFYNFVQRPMITNKGRPSKRDYIIGWNTFFDIVNILKPDVCIFIGTSSSNYLNEYNNKNPKDFTILNYKWTEKISRTFARKAKIRVNSKEIDLHFIQHTSQYFSWSKWHKHLKRILPEQIEYWKRETITFRKL